MIEKFKDGETLQDYRIKRRNERRNDERSVKTAIRVRDGIGCRWPGCEYWKRGYRVEGAHLDAKGIGGDPKLIRTTTGNLMRVCVKHHQGPFSLHSGDLRVVFLTERRRGWAVRIPDQESRSGTRVGNHRRRRRLHVQRTPQRSRRGRPMTATDLPLSAATDDAAAQLAPRVMAIMADGKWRTAKEIAERCSGLNERTMRIIAERSDGELIGGQRGYRLTQFATAIEARRAESWLQSQGRKMIARAISIRNARARCQKR